MKALVLMVSSALDTALFFEDDSWILTPLTTGSNLLAGYEVLLLAIYIVAFLPISFTYIL